MLRAVALVALVSTVLAVLAIGTAWKFRGDLADANAQIEGYKEATRLLDEHLRYVDSERQKWADRARALDTVEGANEPLNPYERAVLDCVRTGQCNP